MIFTHENNYIYHNRYIRLQIIYIYKKIWEMSKTAISYCCPLKMTTWQRLFFFSSLFELQKFDTFQYTQTVPCEWQIWNKYLGLSCEQLKTKRKTLTRPTVDQGLKLVPALQHISPENGCGPAYKHIYWVTSHRLPLNKTRYDLKTVIWDQWI